MDRAPIDVGAFSWGRIQRLYDADAAIPSTISIRLLVEFCLMGLTAL